MLGNHNYFNGDKGLFRGIKFLDKLEIYVGNVMKYNNTSMN